MVVVHYGMLVKDASGSSIISLPLQTEAIPCPAVGSLFEIEGVTAGWVIEAATVLKELPQQSSGTAGERIFTHIITLSPARADQTISVRTANFPDEAVARTVGHRNFQREWTVQLWPHQPHAPLASLIASQIVDWSSVRTAEVLMIGPGGTGIPSSTQFGFVGMEFTAQRGKSYAFELETELVEDEMHMNYFTVAGAPLHSAIVRSDRPGHWFIMCPVMQVDEVCRVTASRLSSATNVRQVTLHCINLF